MSKPKSSLSGQLQRAKTLYSQGNLNPASAACKKIIREYPENISALQLLSLIEIKKERIPKAIALWEKIVALKPDRADLGMNLGALYVKEKDFSRAKEHMEKAVWADPNEPQGWIELGKCYAHLEQYPKVEECYSRVAELRPGFRVEENLGDLYLQFRVYQRAERAYRKAVDKRPSADNYCNWGFSLEQIGELQKALQAYRGATDHDSSHVNSWNNLGNLLRNLEDIEGARTAFERAVNLGPNIAQPYSNLAALYERSNRLGDAKRMASRALGIKADDFSSQLILAVCERREGNYQKALVRLENLESGMPASTHKKKVLYSEIAFCRDALGEYERAFEDFGRANQISLDQWRARGRDPREFFHQISPLVIKGTATWAPNQGPASVADANPKLIFLFGFPRSGTTLTGRIVGAHSAVVELDEKPTLKAVRDALFESYEHYLDVVANLDEQIILVLREHYLDSVREHCEYQAGQVILDKHPMHSVWVALISRVFPEAKMVFISRDPRDVCLSCYMQNFNLNRVMINFCDLQASADLYTRVIQIYGQHCAAFGANPYELKYERLVNDVEGEAKKLLAYLGLDWEPSVLKFYERAQDDLNVRTASYHQVVQPIYSSSMGKWKNYRQQLQPIIERFKYNGRED